MSHRPRDTGPHYEWDHPLVTLPPLVRLVVERLLELGAEARAVLAQLRTDALEAEGRSDQAAAAASRALAELSAGAGGPDLLHVLRNVSTAVEHSGHLGDALPPLRRT